MKATLKNYSNTPLFRSPQGEITKPRNLRNLLEYARRSQAREIRITTKGTEAAILVIFLDGAEFFSPFASATVCKDFFRNRRRRWHGCRVLLNGKPWSRVLSQRVRRFRDDPEVIVTTKLLVEGLEVKTSQCFSLVYKVGATLFAGAPLNPWQQRLADTLAGDHFLSTEPKQPQTHPTHHPRPHP